jgi:hypothetical protein
MLRAARRRCARLLRRRGAWAGIPTFCERGKEVGAADQDRVLRFAGAVKRELERSGQPVALISRAGLDLSRFGLLYSHAGIALKDNPAALDRAPAVLRLRRIASAPVRPGRGRLRARRRRAGTRATCRWSSSMTKRRAARTRRRGQAPGAGAAGRPVQRQRLRLRHPLPELQSVGRGDARRAWGRLDGPGPRASARRTGCANKAMRPGR